MAESVSGPWVNCQFYVMFNASVTSHYFVTQLKGISFNFYYKEKIINKK